MDDTAETVMETKELIEQQRNGTIHIQYILNDCPPSLFLFLFVVVVVVVVVVGNRRCAGVLLECSVERYR